MDKPRVALDAALGHGPSPGVFTKRGSVGAGKLWKRYATPAQMGAITVGGAVGHDNAVIPRSEAFFDLDHGWKTGETTFVRGVEIAYGQHGIGISRPGF